MRILALLFLMSGCSETTLVPFKPPLPDTEPEYDADLFGEPPDDWENCYRGFLGFYSNLPDDHADVLPVEDYERPEFETLDWWNAERNAFQRYDGSLDFGPNWWPVDTGLVADPAYFAVRWIGWMRITKKITHEFIVAGSTDVWVLSEGQPLVSIEGSEAFETETYEHEIPPGKYRVDIRYAHRFGEDNGFRFRAHSEHLYFCYPNYSGD